MKQKLEKNFIYEGFGFPLELHNVKLIKVEDEWCPQIDVRSIADKTIRSLIQQNNRLTGNQIKFMRTYFSMSLREFADKLVNESHTAVNKWEKYGNNVTNMDINIEKMLRLNVYNKLAGKTTIAKIEFYKLYQKINKLSAKAKVSNSICVIAVA